jgi:tetratricopeptide (TPR) repeat protein
MVKAASLLPGESKPWNGLARILRREGNLSGALAAASWAVRLNDGDQASRVEKAEIEKSAGVKTAPLAATVDFGAKADTALEHAAFASRLKVRQDYLGAVGELLRALALQPAGAEARAQLADNYALAGDASRAVLEYRKSLRIAPDNGVAHLCLGRLLLRSGDSDGALREFRQALQFLPGNADVIKGLEQASGTPKKPL